MKKLFFLIVLFAPCFLFAQTCSDTLYIKRDRCFMNGKKLSITDLNKLLKTNDSAYTEIKMYSNVYVADVIVSGVAGFALGYSLGAFIASSSHDINTTLFLSSALIGFTTLAWSIHLGRSVEVHLRNAVDIYNRKYLSECSGK